MLPHMEGRLAKVMVGIVCLQTVLLACILLGVTVEARRGDVSTDTRLPRLEGTLAAIESRLADLPGLTAERAAVAAAARAKPEPDMAALEAVFPADEAALMALEREWFLRPVAEVVEAFGRPRAIFYAQWHYDLPEERWLRFEVEQGLVRKIVAFPSP
jgi:hypothetical protein